MKKSNKYPELTALKGRIREQGTSYRKLADAIGLAVGTLSDKINGYYFFNAEEISDICEALNITDSNEVVKIFFPKILRNSIKSA